MPNPCRLGAGLTLISMPGWLAFRVDGIIFASGRAGTIPFVKSWAYPFDNPTECSGPPHLLGPWGSAGRGRCEWPPHDTAPGRPPCFPEKYLAVPMLGTQEGARRGAPVRPQSQRSLDLGFAKFDVLLSDRVIFLLHELVGHRARILLGHIIETGVRARHQLHLDRGRLGHDETLAKQ